jgi:hypothetical protein
LFPLPLCFPNIGCGRVFSDPRAAALHQREHVGKPRVIVRANQTDQRLRPFWPATEQLPWIQNWSPAARRKAKLRSEHGMRYVSALSGRRFMKEKEARAEMQYYERNLRKEPKKRPDPRYEIIGARTHVPPGLAPSRAPVAICKRHWPNKKVPSRCERCKVVKRLLQPVLPCVFFNQFRARVLAEDDGAERVPDGQGGFIPVFDTIVFDTANEGGLRPLLKTSLGPATPIEIVAMALDTNNDYWINYSRYWGKLSLVWCRYQPSSDFMDRWEVLKETESHWARLEDIVGSCFVIECTRSEFKDRLKRKLLPKSSDVFFTRDNFSAAFWEGKQQRRERRQRMRSEAAAAVESKLQRQDS